MFDFRALGQTSRHPCFSTPHTHLPEKLREFRGTPRIQPAVPQKFSDKRLGFWEKPVSDGLSLPMVERACRPPDAAPQTVFFSLIQPMNTARPIPRLVALTLPLISLGEEEPGNDPQWVRTLGELHFEDRFEQEETDPQREDLGTAWTTSSAERAKGNKQVTLSEGFLQITRHPEADHAVSFRQPLEFVDGAIEARIRLGARDDFSLNFADTERSSVHAGHLSLTRWTLKNVTITDAKTDIFDLALRERRLKGEKSPELVALLAAKNCTFPCALTPRQ